MTHLITLAKPIMLQLARSYVEPVETFQWPSIALRVELGDADPGLLMLEKGPIPLHVTGAIHKDSERNDVIDLATLGGCQHVTIRGSEIRSVAPCAPQKAPIDQVFEHQQAITN